ncbi:hydroxymethylglutaryl-CoA synthase 1 [Nilaparvata lugens]|uniref:hydroxymethylglutaryl-CoA synthase 1 n=1 Tax=Nilaparvata lugens TaxID=108931 RepID=UPI00193D6469|nr:hydroxymethylglutaryl-CoA synthase 1 [Nilaparvata lugens]XP_039295598.1 hydroxymethylglutaryl-CoA synthase 1 [Nilaparvata lugens]XP_039295599.1 hydroxymethylglutaryl-CoA synthase 1 [Nilaparvata lugens]XP_039295600.1 hydroxymethylglutaryl-CoA synthase 1 [Nilaparvata lugens]XP_039295601.1 hydroxymethylglutaryl-CoA synthase 1 [Nilaparvata lugens]
MGSWPDDVGILALELVVPPQYVDQTDLEIQDGVSAGKYTIGLGQSKMAFCSDREDVNSLCLTAVARLMEKHNIRYEDIGRLEVGTETIIDKSKSVKSVLMQLFEDSGNTDIEGIDTTNACYGGTAALFNCAAWLESSAWDGRLALAVAADIAVYAEGSARPTGGAGAVAILLGPNAPLVLERRVRASHMQHAYDFYKPDPRCEYPVVDGKLSIKCYLSALDKCYRLYCSKQEKLNNNSRRVGLASLDAMLFHSPYCKLVQKSLARIVFNDFLIRSADPTRNADDVPLNASLQRFANLRLEDTYLDRDVEKAFVEESRAEFERKTQPSLLVAREVGNMYTPSLYGGLISHLVATPRSRLVDSRIGLFSYGSGLAATMYSLRVREPGLDSLLAGLSHVTQMLDSRQKVPADKFCARMRERESVHLVAPYEPKDSVDLLLPGTYYLTNIDEQYRRSYTRK